MRRLIPAIVFLTFHANVNAATITFSTDPFAGSTALTTPGRQVVGNELFTAFDVATDVFDFNNAVFGIDEILFANDLAANLPATGVNTVVLQTLDNDANPATPFGAGMAANLIAAQITQSGPGFFVYFNSALNLPRLVYSVDLSDNAADLKILARLTNLSGQPNVLPAFTAQNFAVTQVPEPATLLLMTMGGGLWAARRLSRRARS
jgi:PEP-CTERM motif